MTDYLLRLERLKLTPDTARARDRRWAAILEARSWPRGPSQSQKAFVSVSPPHEGLTVRLGKPGKEAFRKKPNELDMTPTVFEGPVALDLLPGFDDIFCEFEVIADTNAGGGAEQALELVACLLFRSTMMLDHLEIEAGANRWRYTPPVEVLEIVERTVPRMPLSELPLRTYLHLLDAIAWNEDVKYSRAATTKSQVPRDTGRPNMLATCVTFILMTLGRLARPGFCVG